MVINGVERVQAIQPSAVKKADVANEDGLTSKKTGKDVFERSSTSRALKDMNIWGFEPKTKGVITGEEIITHAKQFLSDFYDDLYGMLKPLGIDTEQEIELGVQAGTGKVIVKNDHPEKEKIEKIFENRPEYENEFRKITSMFELYETGKETAEFHKAYEANAEAAVAKYYYLFNTSLSADITFSSEGAEVDFTRVDRKSGSYVSDYQDASYFVSSE